MQQNIPIDSLGDGDSSELPKKSARTGPLIVLCVALTTAGGFVLVLLAARSHGQPVIDRWIQGALTSDSKVGGLDVRWWARIGKFLQFLAGCAVVLDLLRPETLRSQGRRLRSWHQSSLQLLNLVRTPDNPLFVAGYMRASVFSDVAGVSAPDDPSPTIVAGIFLQPGRPPDVRSSPSVPQGEMNSWHQRTVQHLKDDHGCHGRDCGHASPVCKVQDKYLDESITSFLRKFYGQNVDLLASGESNIARVTSLARIAVMLLLIPIVVFLGSFQYVFWGPQSGLAPLPFVIFIVVFCPLFYLHDVPLMLLRARPVKVAARVILWTVSVPVGRILRGTAAMLDATRPAHTLRYVAFGLFLNGFLPDLLSA